MLQRFETVTHSLSHPVLSPEPDLARRVWAVDLVLCAV